MGRCIGMDVHRDFAQVAVWERGKIRDEFRVGVTGGELREFVAGLRRSDQVALEATTNSAVIARLVATRAGRVVVSNPLKTRAIAEAKVKTDRVDARVLAELLAADYLPQVWQAPEELAALRRQVSRRAHLVRQRTRLKNQVQAVLARNLLPRCPAADLFGRKGRRWLAAQDLPLDEQWAVEALLRQLDFHGDELARLDAELATVALDSVDTRRLMTIPGVDVTVALSVVAAVGDWTRFPSPDKLIAYLGLNPRVRQSGGQPAAHGRITKLGRSHARGMLCEAAWSASKTPGPLRAFYERIKARRGMQIAVVATARKLATICWHLIRKGVDYAFTRPSLVAKKQRALELKAGAPPAKGRKGSAAGYSLAAVRRAETELAQAAEAAYAQMIAAWQPRPRSRTG
jgi:transposase